MFQFIKSIIVTTIRIPITIWYHFAYILIREKRLSREVLNNFETLNYIIGNNCSISRYGDGELDLAIKGRFPELSYNSGFQEYNQKLAERLIEILDYSKPANNHIVCLPACSFSYGTSYFRRQARFFGEEYTVKKIDFILQMTKADRLYGETNISRLYLSHKDKSRCREFVNLFKKNGMGKMSFL